MADECQPPDHDDRGARDECARTPLIRGRRSEAEYQPDRIESELEVDNSPSRRLQSWLLTLHTRRDEAQGRRDRPDTWYLHLLSPGWTGTEDSRSRSWRSEEHTSELQSRGHLVCRLLLEKKKTTKQQRNRLATDTATHK